jgi:hypothetical protein
MNNHRTPAELKFALDAIIEELKALDTATITDAELVPLTKSLEDVASYVKSFDARIQLRVLTDKVAVPGVATKPGITHRKWNDEDAVASLAYEAYGLKAFKLLTPAAVEKLGEDGVALVAIASTKPDAQDRVVY